jgi:preprotein translocase subunit YajC
MGKWIWIIIIAVLVIAGIYFIATRQQANQGTVVEEYEEVMETMPVPAETTT